MQFDQLKRRAFITLLGAAAAMWPLAARAQQPLPVIGFLHQGSPEPLSLMNAFWKGLSEAGIIDIQDVTIEDRAEEGHYDRLPALAVERAEHRAAVIAANGAFSAATLAEPSQQKGRRWPQCTRLDPSAALRRQTTHSFDCFDAASPSRSHSSACLRSISRAKGSSVFSAAWRQSLAWCSQNSTCDDIGPTSCGHLMPARNAVAQPRLAVGVANVHSSRGVRSTFKAAPLDFVERVGA